MPPSRPMQVERGPQRSAFLAHMVSRALRHRIERNFSRTSWSGSVPEAAPDQGLLLYSNHPSWWDPAVFALLQHKFFSGRAGYGPIDAQAVRRYPLLTKAGFLPVDPQSPRSVRVLLGAAQQILANGGVFWLTAQGRFADNRLRPLGLKPGLAHIARSMPGAQIVPVALDYRFGTQSRPEIAVRFGNPVILPAATRNAQALVILETALTDTLDRLTMDILSGQVAFHTTLTEQAAGTGGLYGSLQHVASWLRFRRHDSRHAPSS